MAPGEWRHRQRLLRPAAQEDIRRWVGSSTTSPQPGDAAGAIRWNKQRVSDPAAGSLKLMGLVGRCGSVVHASPQGKGGRKLFLSI